MGDTLEVAAGVERVEALLVVAVEPELSAVMLERALLLLMLLMSMVRRSPRPA